MAASASSSEGGAGPALQPSGGVSAAAGRVSKLMLRVSETGCFGGRSSTNTACATGGWRGRVSPPAGGGAPPAGGGAGPPWGGVGGGRRGTGAPPPPPPAPGY